MNNEQNKQLEQLVQNLTIVKEEFFKNKDELKVSIRKDNVAVDLKSILQTAKTFEELKISIQNYIDNLLTK